MDRLANKCVIASSILHGTLVVVLLVGPAFFMSNEQPSSKDILDFIPSTTIDQAMSGGGNPNVATPPPTPQPQPAPPPPQPAPPPPRPAERPVERQPQPAPEPPKPRTPQVNLTRKVTNPNLKPQPDTSAQDRARTEAEAKRRQETLRNAMTNIRANTGSKVDIGEVAGPGGGGPSYASFEAVLRSIYFNNWREPSDVTLEDAVVKATVTISRDGTVISARITKGSGDPAVDRSVRQLLEDVTFIAPFPTGAKENQRTYPLSFSLKAKRGLG